MIIAGLVILARFWRLALVAVLSAIIVIFILGLADSVSMIGR
jgi:hypothetical protein